MNLNEILDFLTSHGMKDESLFWNLRIHNAIHGKQVSYRAMVSPYDWFSLPYLDYDELWMIGEPEIETNNRWVVIEECDGDVELENIIPYYFTDENVLFALRSVETGYSHRIVWSPETRKYLVAAAVEDRIVFAEGDFVDAGLNVLKQLVQTYEVENGEDYSKFFPE